MRSEEDSTQSRKLSVGFVGRRAANVQESEDLKYKSLELDLLLISGLCFLATRLMARNRRSAAEPANAPAQRIPLCLCAFASDYFLVPSSLVKEVFGG
jgi:hypothetical protein